MTTPRTRIELKHNPIFPDPLLCCVVGATKSGKTYLLFHILTHHEKLIDFNELILYIPEITQKDPEYLFLKHGFEKGIPPSIINSLYHVYKNNKNLFPEDIEEICEVTRKSPEVISKLQPPISVLISHKPSEDVLLNNKKTCVILDDVLGEKNQTFQQNLFQRGRHGNCSVFYLAQNFTNLDKNTIRENTTCYIIFRQKETNLNRIINNIETSLENKEFRMKCKEAWKNKYGYIYINTRAEDNEVEMTDNILIKKTIKKTK